MPRAAGRHPRAGRREPRVRGAGAAADAAPGRAAARRPAHSPRLMTAPPRALERRSPVRRAPSRLPRWIGDRPAIPHGPPLVNYVDCEEYFVGVFLLF